MYEVVEVAEVVLHSQQVGLFIRFAISQPALVSVEDGAHFEVRAAVVA